MLCCVENLPTESAILPSRLIVGTYRGPTRGLSSNYIKPKHRVGIQTVYTEETAQQSHELSYTKQRMRLWRESLVLHELLTLCRLSVSCMHSVVTEVAGIGTKPTLGTVLG